jgi:hypothetical protein
MTRTIGILLALLGFIISFVSLGLATSTGARMTIVLAEIAVSLFGIIGVLNGYYLKNTIWRK